jgi:hypothetical protein
MATTPPISSWDERNAAVCCEWSFLWVRGHFVVHLQPEWKNKGALEEWDGSSRRQAADSDSKRPRLRDFKMTREFPGRGKGLWKTMSAGSALEMKRYLKGFLRRSG